METYNAENDDVYVWEHVGLLFVERSGPLSRDMFVAPDSTTLAYHSFQNANVTFHNVLRRGATKSAGFLTHENWQEEYIATNGNVWRQQ